MRAARQIFDFTEGAAWRGLVAMNAVLLYSRNYSATAILGYFVLVLLLSRWLISERLVKWRFRKSPYHNDHTRIEVSVAGLNAVGRQSRTQKTWGIITKARKFEDGFLLIQRVGVFNWLPSSAIMEGSALEADELFSSHGADYKRA
jgi:hypothetical protein